MKTKRTFTDRSEYLIQEMKTMFNLTGRQPHIQKRKFPALNVKQNEKVGHDPACFYRTDVDRNRWSPVSVSEQCFVYATEMAVFDDESQWDTFMATFEASTIK